MNTVYLGTEYSRDFIRTFLTEHNIHYSEFKNEHELTTTVARLIRDGHVVGWFQGRMEFGPRALGARSILADPTNPKMRDILNLKVKHREKFRPFAPVICAEDASTFFECDSPLPESTDFMLMVYPFKKKYHRVIPSVVHVDGSGRLQTVKEHQHKQYYRLIKEFGKLSRIPMLVNTSFNIRGEPIVCSPYDAYRCMMGTEIDYIVMDTFLIKREENPQHVWNSEKYATD